MNESSRFHTKRREGSLLSHFHNRTRFNQEGEFQTIQRGESLTIVDTSLLSALRIGWSGLNFGT